MNTREVTYRSIVTVKVDTLEGGAIGQQYFKFSPAEPPAFMNPAPGYQFRDILGGFFISRGYGDRVPDSQLPESRYSFYIRLRDQNILRVLEEPGTPRQVWYFSNLNSKNPQLFAKAIAWQGRIPKLAIPENYLGQKNKAVLTAATLSRYAGKELRQMKYRNIPISAYQIDMREMPGGAYSVKLEFASGKSWKTDFFLDITGSPLRPLAIFEWDVNHHRGFFSESYRLVFRSRRTYYRYTISSPYPITDQSVSIDPASYDGHQIGFVPSTPYKKNGRHLLSFTATSPLSYEKQRHYDFKLRMGSNNAQVQLPHPTPAQFGNQTGLLRTEQVLLSDLHVHL
ncbi:MAG: hypothetical protein AAGN35_02310 [Bacteroidota bacterium]